MRNCSHKVSIVLILTALASMALAKGKELKNLVETRTEKLRAGVRFEFSRSLRPGRLLKARDGQDGTVSRTYRVTYEDGKPISKELVKEATKEPQPTIFLMGRGGLPSDRGSFMRKKVLDMFATAYDPSPRSNGRGSHGRTRTGERARYGVVAVDPRVIPLGSILFVEGYGLALACDTGSAIKGNRIDLCYESGRTANSFGSKMVRVHVLGLR